MIDRSKPSRDLKDRVPPGQAVTEKWPVLHYGSIPRFNPATWDFQVWGLVKSPVRLPYAEFLALPHATLRCDIHCVTAWSRLGVEFEGVPARTALELGRPKPEAKFVMVQAGPCAWSCHGCTSGRARSGCAGWN